MPEQIAPTPETPIITPPVRPGPNKKLILIPLIVIGSLLALMILISIVKALQPRKGTLPPPPPIVTNPSGTTTATPVKIPVTPFPPRLALTQLAGHQLVTTSDNKIWLTKFTPEGPIKSTLLDLGYKVVDLSLSPNKKLLAFTYSGSSLPNGSFDYPKTGLKVLDLTTFEVTEFVTLGDSSVRRPTWSSDSIYLAIWNNGTSVILYDMTNKSRPLRIDANPMGQIVFIPGQAKFSYVEGTNLIESDYTGAVKKTLLTDVNPVRGIGQGELSPDLHVYPPDNSSIIYHNTSGQLVLYRRADSSRQILAEGMPSRTTSGFYSFGDVVGVNSTSDFLAYFNLGKEVYVPGPDDNPLYIYNLKTKLGKPFFPNRKDPVTIGGLYLDPQNIKILFADSGYRVFDYDGKMVSSCPNTMLNNDVVYSSSRLWTPDSKYFLSQKTYQVTDTLTCAITAPVESVIPESAIWIK